MAIYEHGADDLRGEMRAGFENLRGEVRAVHARVDAVQARVDALLLAMVLACWA
jgi:hypothetical protein